MCQPRPSLYRLTGLRTLSSMTNGPLTPPIVLYRIRGETFIMRGSTVAMVPVRKSEAGGMGWRSARGVRSRRGCSWAMRGRGGAGAVLGGRKLGSTDRACLAQLHHRWLGVCPLASSTTICWKGRNRSTVQSMAENSAAA
jgi:hypothetical protein